MLRGEVAHEAEDCGEATPRALAAPVVAVPARRVNRTGGGPRVAQSRPPPFWIEPLECVHVQVGQPHKGQAFFDC